MAELKAGAGGTRRRAAKRGLPGDLLLPHVLREYALLADGERGILVGPRGDFAWMCFPCWHSDAVCASLIGGLGTYSIGPRGRSVWGGHYEPGSLIWRSRWITDDATIECREALLLPSRKDRAVVLRRVIALHGDAAVRVLLAPRAAFGREPIRRLRRDDDGLWAGRTGEVALLWGGGAHATPIPDGHGGRALTLHLELAAGEQHDFVLALQTPGRPDGLPEPEQAWEQLEREWRGAVPPLGHTIAPRDAAHAYAVMHGLTSPAGGGMVAAATTSLPERARAGRSFDYRYVWIRDQCYAGQAVARCGPHALLDAAVTFVTERLLDDGPELMPAYTAAGERVPDEGRLGLPGYPGGADVVGNWVNSQFQLDAFGEALLLLASAAEHDHLDAHGWDAADVAVATIERRWCEGGVDAGIWELDPDDWAHSRLICAAGLRRAARARGDAARAGRWSALADRIVEDTAARCLHPSGRWQRAPDDDRVDAALLLPGLRGAVPDGDPRSKATLRAVLEDLSEDGYCYRYRPDERPLGQAEGAFLLCGFWVALALARSGEELAAARWFERSRAACGPPGLFSEEYDVGQRQLRGNLPQAFVHALLLEAAAELGDSGRAGLEGDADRD
jgi:hypothetical protein